MTNSRHSRTESDLECELSGREVQVLTLVALGQTNREIGAALSISEGTVKNHLKSIARKLGARDRTHAVVLAMANGDLDQPAVLVGHSAEGSQGKG